MPHHLRSINEETTAYNLDVTIILVFFIYISDVMPFIDYCRYAKRPEQWKSRQATKESAFKEFYATFGPKTTSSKNNSFLSNTHRSSQPEKVKEMRKEIDNHVATLLDPSPKTAGKHAPEVDANSARDNKVLKAKNKKRKSIDKGDSDNVVASKAIDVQSEKSSKSDDKKLKKRHKEESTSKSSRKKLKS